MPAISGSSFVEGDSIASGRTSRRNVPSDTNSTRAWIIVASVAGVLVLGACIALLALALSKRHLRGQSSQEARQRDPFLDKKDSNKKRRRAKDVLEFDAESQRDAIIRKSLASRSGRSISVSSQFTASSVEERPASRSTHEHKSRFEEEFESDLSHSQPGRGLASVKGWESGCSARSRSPLPDLPAPTYSRSSSPSRPLQQLAMGRAEPPPPLEHHPLFRNVLSDESDLRNERK